MTNECFIVIHKKKGLKSLISKLVYLQKYQATSGIQKGRNPRIKSGLNMAGLAQLLEEGFTWTQKKNLAFTINDNKVFLKAGKEHTIPARPFISLNKYVSIWEQIKNYARQLVLNYLTPNVGKKSSYCKQLFQLLANFVAIKQKSIIGSSRLEDNAPLTILLKGSNTPLQETGDLQDSLSGKVEKSKNYTKQQSLQQIDKIMTDINKYIGKGKLV